jgi:DNA-binding transcriptional LysR family regulator
VSILPRHTVQKEVGVRTLATVGLDVPDLARPVGIIHRRQKPLTPTASRFVEMLKNSSGSAAPTGETRPAGARAAVLD